MDLADVHGAAGAILRAAGHDEWDAAGAVALARRLVGPGGVIRVPGLRRPAMLEEARDAPVILLRARLAPADANFLVAHELAEWWLTREGCRGDRIEEEIGRASGRERVERTGGRAT